MLVLILFASIRTDKRLSRIEQTGRESHLRSSVNHSKSLSARQQHRQRTSNFWASRSSSQGVPGSRLSRRSQNTAAMLAVPPPILDVMLEDSAAEVTTSPSAKVFIFIESMTPRLLSSANKA